MKSLVLILALGVVLVSLEACASPLQVGPGRSHSTLSSSLRSARSGDVIEINAGVYEDESVTITGNDLTIRGIGGVAHLKWVNGFIPNRKGILLIQGNRITLENLELSGARVDDGNGAGIRVEPKSSVTIRNCYIHDNENGILTSNDHVSSVLIENTEFDRNGDGTGQTHNIYIGAIDSFTLRYSYSHRAHIGHNVKSRAKKNFITYNRIMDEADGDSSYLIDLPNGGETYIIGNLLQKNRKADNHTLISYGAEGFGRTDWATRLYVVNNTLVSDYGPNTVFLSARAGTSTAEVMNNIFSGPGKLTAGKGDGSFWNFTTNLKVDGDPGFRSVANYDYRLTSSATGAIDRGTTPGKVDDVSLLPTGQYVHPMKGAPRSIVGTAIDIGAYEFGSVPLTTPSAPESNG